MVSDMKFANLVSDDKVNEELYRRLFISSQLFKVENPEQFLVIMMEYTLLSKGEPFEVFAKRVFNRTMGTRFTDCEIDVEVMYLIKFIKEAAVSVKPDIFNKNNLEVLNVISEQLTKGKKKKIVNPILCSNSAIFKKMLMASSSY